MSKFKLGTIVRKKSGAKWAGRVVGHYSTELTPDGVCVESDREIGSVQIYPVAALERIAYTLRFPYGGPLFTSAGIALGEEYEWRDCVYRCECFTPRGHAIMLAVEST